MPTSVEKRQPKLSGFKERFSSLRPEKMTQKDFAVFLGIARPTVAFYENGERIPDASILKKICTRCGVSADWLLGLSDAMTSDSEIQAIVASTGLSETAVCWLISQQETVREYGRTDTIGIFDEIISGFVELRATMDVADAVINYRNLKDSLETQERRTPESSIDLLTESGRKQYEQLLADQADINQRSEIAYGKQVNIIPRREAVKYLKHKIKEMLSDIFENIMDGGGERWPTLRKG